MRINIANALTTLRLILVPFFIYAFVFEHRQMALIFFAVAGFTDLIDGTAARYFGGSTKYGAILDPIADKLLVQSCFSLLVWAGLLPLWFFIIALARDVMIVSGILYLEFKKAELPYRAIYASKFATLFMLVLAVLALVRWQDADLAATTSTIALWQSAFMYAAFVLILISSAQYIRLGLAFLEQKRNSEKCGGGHQ